MSKKNIRTIKYAYGISLAVWTGLVGALFILQAWSIFLSAERSPYTIDSIGEKFRQIALPFALWGLAVIGGVVFDYLVPEMPKKEKSETDIKKNLYRLKGRLPQNEGGRYALSKENVFRRIVVIASVALCVALGGVVIFLLFNDGYAPVFKAEILTEHNGAAERLIFSSIWIVCAFAVAIIASGLLRRSFQRETENVKKQIAENAKLGIKSVKNQQEKKTFCVKYPFFASKQWKIGIRVALGLLAIVLIVIGIANGGMLDVYDKAKKICTQCIGLG